MRNSHASWQTTSWNENLFTLQTFWQMEHAVIVQVCVPERKSTIGLSSFEKGEHSRSELKQSLRETFTQICKPRDKVIGLQ